MRKKFSRRVVQDSKKRIRSKIAPAMVEKGYHYEVRSMPVLYQSSFRDSVGQKDKIIQFINDFADRLGGVKGGTTSIRRLNEKFNGRVVLFLRNDTELALLMMMKPEPFAIEAVYRLEKEAGSE